MAVVVACRAARLLRVVRVLAFFCLFLVRCQRLFYELRVSIIENAVIADVVNLSLIGVHGDRVGGFSGSAFCNERDYCEVGK